MSDKLLLGGLDFFNACSINLLYNFSSRDNLHEITTTSENQAILEY